MDGFDMFLFDKSMLFRCFFADLGRGHHPKRLA